MATCPTPIRDIYDSLKPLEGVCTWDILHKAREETYGEDYQQCTRSSQDGSVETRELLLSLDRSGHVPNDYPDIVAFESHIRKFARTLAGPVVKEFVTSKSDGGSCELEEVRPIGSFPANTKVGDIDEFDYLIIVDREIKAYHSALWSQMANISYKIYHILIDKKHDAISSKLLRIKNIHEHGPAICVELAWKCKHGHDHCVGIDLTLALEGTFDDTMRNEIIERVKSVPLLDGLVDEVDKAIWIYKGDGTSLSSCNFDNDIFAKVEKCIPRFRLAYRLVKVIVGKLLPSAGTCDGAWIHRNYHPNPLASSHFLKMLLLDELKDKPDPSDWNDDRLINRLWSILTKVKEQLQKNTAIDLISGSELLFYMPMDNGIHDSIVNLLERFISHLSQTPCMYPPSPSHGNSFNKQHEPDVEPLEDGLVYIVHTDTWFLDIRLYLCTYKAMPCVPVPYQQYLKHPIIQSIGYFKREVCIDSQSKRVHVSELWSYVRKIVEDSLKKKTQKHFVP